MYHINIFCQWGFGRNNSSSSDMDNSQEHWDLTTKDNFPLAYGVYIFHVDAPGIGEKLGRFAVIK